MLRLVCLRYLMQNQLITEKNKARALKFHHRKRLKIKRRNNWDGSASLTEKRLGISINTPRPCSCWLCGKRRFHHGVTYQEQKIRQKFAQDDFNDLHIH